MKLPYKFQYNGELPDIVKYNGQVVDIFKIGDEYIPANEASYLRFTARTGSARLIKIEIKNEDDHNSMILIGTDDNPPKPYSSGYISPGSSIAYRMDLPADKIPYIIIPFKHSIVRARGVTYDRYKFQESYSEQQSTSISGYIGGKCVSIADSACMGICVGSFTETLEFSPKFTGTIEANAFYSTGICQDTIDIGGATEVANYAFRLGMPNETVNAESEMNLTITTSHNLTSMGIFYINARQTTGQTFNITYNLPSTGDDVIVGDIPYLGFVNINANYPNSTTTNVTYNFAENLNDTTAQECYPGLWDEELGGFAYRFNVYNQPTKSYNILATVNYILPAVGIKFKPSACTITPPEHNNVSAEFCSILGNSEEMVIPNGFILGKSRLGDGSVYIDHLDYFNSRYMSNEYGTFNTPFNIHLETTTNTNKLTLMFDEQNDYHPTYISYSYVNSAGQTIIKTNADNTSRVTLTFDEPTNIIDITISTWNMPEEPLIITGIYAGDLENE